MPGFIIGGVGEGPDHKMETRRKHRWIFQTLGRGTGGGGTGQFPSEILLILKEASRPHPTIEEPEMHHNQEQAYFAGKHHWDPISLVWYDGEQPNDVSQEIWYWLNGVIGIHTGNIPVYIPSAYKQEGSLIMRQGDGSESERWQLFGCWPQDIDWGGLDYTDTEIQTIECTMRFDRANRAT